MKYRNFNLLRYGKNRNVDKSLKVLKDEIKDIISAYRKDQNSITHANLTCAVEEYICLALSKGDNEAVVRYELSALGLTIESLRSLGLDRNLLFEVRDPRTQGIIQKIEAGTKLVCDF